MQGLPLGFSTAGNLSLFNSLAQIQPVLLYSLYTVLLIVRNIFGFAQHNFSIC